MKVTVQIPAPVGVPFTDKHRNDPFGYYTSGGIATHWVTKEERRVKIKDMTDVHLINSIRMMEREGPTAYAEDLIAMENFTFSCRGEMASYYAERDLNHMYSLGPEGALDENPVYLGLTKEALRRKLKWKP